MADDLDKILDEIEAEKIARRREEEKIGESLRPDEAQADRVKEERQSKISGFKLDLDVDAAFAQTELPARQEEDGEPAEPAEPEGGIEVPADNLLVARPPEETPPAGEEPAPETGGQKKKKNKKARTTWGCIRGIIYAALVLGISGTLAYFAITGGIDLTGINKPERPTDIEVPLGASTETVARVLKEAGIIDQPLVFRLYSKFTDADGKYQPGVFTVSPHMGYQEIISKLQVANARGTAQVTIPEGSTAADIARLLEQKGVCSVSDFYDALVNGEYDYEFLSEVPMPEGRIYRLEGYLFPDTYEFYTNSSGRAAINKMLDNFDKRLSTSLRTAMKARGMTLDEAVILASIIQGESEPAEMAKVSRVLHNRLENPSVYPKLECDSTQIYLDKILGSDIDYDNKYYDTYKRPGLPVGAINNPGLDALSAAINPSADATVAKCYFFLTGRERDGSVTYVYSKTLAEHEKARKKYGIGQ